MPSFDARRLAQWSGGAWQSGLPLAINGVSTDTRTLTPGSLFIAIRGSNFDGHDFVVEALRQGACGAMISRDCPAAGPAAPLLRVTDTTRALRDLAAQYRRHLGLKVIAVTGSVGKTTVKEMTADVLAARSRTARTRGNWNNDLGLPLSLLEMDALTTVGVFEVGTNHPGELAPLCRLLAPDWGLLTAVGPVHLKYFKTVEGVAREKLELFRSLPPEGVAVLRGDDPWFEKLRAAAPCRVVTVALAAGADYRGAAVSGAEALSEIFESSTGERLRLRLPVPGRHNLVNALFAVAVGRGCGLGWAEIKTALENYKSPPMRWECHAIDGVTTVNDAYNANPVSMAAALETFAALPVGGRKWLVLAGMLELGRVETQAHVELGTSLARGTWAGLITIGALGEIVADAAEQAGMSPARIFRCAAHAAAAGLLRRKTAPGDAVLLKASRGQRLELVLARWLELAGKGR